jgi:hypothetical protein
LLIFVLIPYANISLTNAIDTDRYPINIISVSPSWHVILALLLLLENVLLQVALVLAWLMFIGAAV